MTDINKDVLEADLGPNIKNETEGTFGLVILLHERADDDLFRLMIPYKVSIILNKMPKEKVDELIGELSGKISQNMSEFLDKVASNFQEK